MTPIASKPTTAQLRFLLAIVRAGGTSRTAQNTVGDWRPIGTCRDYGWVRPAGCDGWAITGTGRDAARFAEPDGYAAALPAEQVDAELDRIAPNQSAPIAVGDRVRGRCVTMQDTVEGTVTEILYPVGLGCYQAKPNDLPVWERRYVVETEETYATGGQRTAVVECAGRTEPHVHDMVEAEMSDCSFGCKIFRCPCGDEQVRHMASYGCPIGKAELAAQQ